MLRSVPARCSQDRLPTWNGSGFVARPLTFGVKIRFIVGWEAFGLALIQIRLESLSCLAEARRPSRNEELLAGEPAARVDDDIADVSCGMVRK